jgi:glycosyltransferase involved in cell wall biosynthesis
MVNRKILIISHNASLSGAPILLFPILQHIRDSGYGIDILLVQGGPLESEFAKYGKVILLNSPTLNSNIASRIIDFIKRVTIEKWKRNRLFEKLNTTLYCSVLSNTLTNGEVLSHIKHPYSIYVHELKTTLAFSLNKDAILTQLNNAYKVFYPSMAVKEFVFNDCKISGLKTVYAPYFFNIPVKIERSAELQKYKNEGFTLVGMSGFNTIRKGIFPFVETLNYIINKCPSAPKMKFVWIGASMEIYEMVFLVPLIEKLKLKEHILFYPPTMYPLGYVDCLDLFFLTSIEDPYPLVAIEAALLKKPIVCFKDSGGMPEFVQDDAGICVPLSDIEAAAKAILSLIENPQLSKTLGCSGFEKALRMHTDTKILENLVRELIS